jgi:[acyl-carrier-protein] S-malonyltransferase
MVHAAVIFTGQGAQSVGMGRDVFDAEPAAREVYARASEVLGVDIALTCFEGPARVLERTDVQQPAIFVTSVAIFRALIARGAQLGWFARAGGLSLGEYTALHVAGAMALEDAVRLVRRRGELMQEAALNSAGGMVSLIGADEAAARAICDAVRRDEVLAPANFNCPGQVVLSGSDGACRRAVALAGERGIRALPLAVAGAFHSPLMSPAADGLATVLAETSFAATRIPVVSNVDAEYHADAASIRNRLERQLICPVLWQRCVERMIADGADHFIEIGPGRILTGLLRKISRDATVTNVSTIEGIEGALARLATD